MYFAKPSFCIFEWCEIEYINYRKTWSFKHSVYQNSKLLAPVFCFEHLSRATCTVNSISAQVSQEGIECKEQYRDYCPYTYTVVSSFKMRYSMYLSEYHYHICLYKCIDSTLRHTIIIRICNIIWSSTFFFFQVFRYHKIDIINSF